MRDSKKRNEKSRESAARGSQEWHKRKQWRASKGGMKAVAKESKGELKNVEAPMKLTLGTAKLS